MFPPRGAQSAGVSGRSGEGHKGWGRDRGRRELGERSERQSPSPRPGGGSAGLARAPRAPRARMSDPHQPGRRRARWRRLEGQRGPEVESPPSLARSGRGAKTPVKSREALGNDSFLPKGLTLGFPPAPRPSPEGSREKHLLPESPSLSQDAVNSLERCGIRVIPGAGNPLPSS